MSWIKKLFGKQEEPSGFVYNGENVDQLIAMRESGQERPDLLAWGAYSALSAKEDKSAATMTIPERSVLAVLKLGHELENGGFHQYLFNTSGRHLPIVENALLEMNRQDVANLVSRAVGIAGLKSPYGLDDVQEVMSGTSDETDEALANLDNQFYELDDLFGSVWPYIIAHRTEIKF